MSIEVPKFPTPTLNTTRSEINIIKIIFRNGFFQMILKFKTIKHTKYKHKMLSRTPNKCFISITSQGNGAKRKI